MPINSQLGFKKEVTYGVPVVVDKFAEFMSEGVELETGRAQSVALRAGQRVARADRAAPYILGAKGSVSIEPLTKGFGFWLEHLLGSVVTTGPVTGAYTHSAFPGSLCGKSFTMQVNRPLGACGDTNQAFTWSGGKVAKWTLGMSVEGLLTLDMDLVFANETTATALAVASYPAGAYPFGWDKAKATVGGVDVDVKSWSVTVDNKLDDGRYFLRENSSRKEPVESDYREISAEFVCDFDNLDHINRVKATLIDNAFSNIVLQVRGPSNIPGGTTPPEINVAITAARWDEAGSSVDGTGIMEQNVKVMAFGNSVDVPVTLSYITADATP